MIKPLPHYFFQRDIFMGNSPSTLNGKILCSCTAGDLTGTQFVSRQ
jgi:hypothetical protein